MTKEREEREKEREKERKRLMRAATKRGLSQKMANVEANRVLSLGLKKPITAKGKYLFNYINFSKYLLQNLRKRPKKRCYRAITTGRSLWQRHHPLVRDESSMG